MNFGNLFFICNEDVKTSNFYIEFILLSDSVSKKQIPKIFVEQWNTLLGSPSTTEYMFRNYVVMIAKFVEQIYY